MRLFYFLVLCQLLTAQRFQTIPQNVFRFSIGKSFSNQSWNFDKQSFNLDGLGNHYFNQHIHNDSVRFSSDHDLYYVGSTYLDSTITVENWLINFNESHNTSLPTLGPQAIDTLKGIEILGSYFEKRERFIETNRINIEYGLSNEITLGISIPYFSSYKVDRSLSDVTVQPIEGVDLLISSHESAQESFLEFMNTGTFSALPAATRDTLTNIYNSFYTVNGENSITWINHAQNDPINHSLIYDSFVPHDIGKDTVTLADLISYYYQNQRTTSGLGDIEVGGTALIMGDPHWSSRRPEFALYGQLFYRIPFGKTTSSYLETGKSQFKEIVTSIGVGQWTFGILGEMSIKGKHRSFSSFGLKIRTNSSEILNTPISLFSGGHTNPDSIVSQVGDTYKFDPGTKYAFDFGYSVETLKNRLWFKFSLNSFFKEQDSFVSKSKDWDQWMRTHEGFDSSNYATAVNIEILGINSYSKNRVGPISFDIFGGINYQISTTNTYAGTLVYSGLITYFQGW